MGYAMSYDKGKNKKENIVMRSKWILVVMGVGFLLTGCVTDTVTETSSDETQVVESVVESTEIVMEAESTIEESSVTEETVEEITEESVKCDFSNYDNVLCNEFTPIIGFNDLPDDYEILGEVYKIGMNPNPSEGAPVRVDNPDHPDRYQVDYKDNMVEGYTDVFSFRMHVLNKFNTSTMYGSDTLEKKAEYETQFGIVEIYYEPELREEYGYLTVDETVIEFVFYKSTHPDDGNYYLGGLEKLLPSILGKTAE